jgi:hypothetical protein
MAFTRHEYQIIIHFSLPSPLSFYPIIPLASGKFLIDLLQASMTFIFLLFVFSMAEQTQHNLMTKGWRGKFVVNVSRVISSLS